MIVKYLAFRMELQKPGMTTIQSDQTQILLFFSYYKVSTWLNYFSDTENYVAQRMHEDYGDRVVSSDLRGEDFNFTLGRFKTVF